MKAFIFFIAIMLSVQNLISQNNGIDFGSIPKNSSKIIVYNNNNKEQNYQLIGETLLNNGFTIDKTNKDFWTISSVPKAGDKVNISYVLSFVSRDSAIHLNGTFFINGLESNPSYSKIQNKGMMGSPVRESFRHLLEFALKLGDFSKLEFKIE